MQRLSCKITDYRTEKLCGSVISVGHLARFVSICWLSTRTLVIPTFILQNSCNIRRLTCKTPAYPIPSLSCKTPPNDIYLKKFQPNYGYTLVFCIYDDYFARFGNREYATIILQISGTTDCYIAGFLNMHRLSCNILA